MKLTVWLFYFPFTIQLPVSYKMKASTDRWYSSKRIGPSPRRQCSSSNQRILKKLDKKLDDQTTNFQWIHDYTQCTEVLFTNFLSGEFTRYYGSNKSTGKQTGKMHLCAVLWGRKIVFAKKRDLFFSLQWHWLSNFDRL